MTFPFSGATGIAVVTGASAGIGATYADRLARRGHDLLLVARRKEKLEGVAQAIRDAHGVAVETMVADLAEQSDLTRVAARLTDDARITMLVNNAGTATFAPVIKTGAAAVAAMIDVNVTALVRLTLAVLPAFTARNSGTIVNIASVSALGELPVTAFYSGTKAFILSFTRGLSGEFATTGIRIQAVLPAPVATDGWDNAGLPLSSLNPASVMSVSHCVDAALAGLDQGETITLPSVEDAATLLANYDAARFALLGAAQSGAPASRYKVAI
ncbi:MAG: SDR family NAD(P)-dependent oxidoreductase [Janthinobacterium lividum]